MSSRILVTAPSANSTEAHLEAIGFDSLAQVRRRLLQAAVSVEGEVDDYSEVEVPIAKLHLLRGFLANLGALNKAQERRLLLMALLQMEDADDAQRFLMPHPVLPILAR